jgi:two-component system invasion response regulator UvrY
MPRVLIADDHAAVRAGYQQFLSTQIGVTELGQASSAQATRELLRSRQWDLLILDIHLPDQAGLSLLKEIRTEFPATRVLVISGLPEDQYAAEALRAGAAGYVSKVNTADELVVAVRRVLGGQRYISSWLAEKLASEVGLPNVPRHEQLSKREQEVFRRVAAGATITAVAEELGLSIKTISTYRSRILEKMNLASNSEITSYAIRHRIL